MMCQCFSCCYWTCLLFFVWMVSLDACNLCEVMTSLINHRCIHYTPFLPGHRLKHVTYLMSEFLHCLLHALNKKYLLHRSKLCIALSFLSYLFLCGHIRYIHISILDWNFCSWNKPFSHALAHTAEWSQHAQVAFLFSEVKPGDALQWLMDAQFPGPEV